jgi:hypothetical protein
MHTSGEVVPPTLFHRAWSLTKAGNSAQQNDDAWHIASIPGEPGLEGLLIALADGATEAIYSGQWARHLVQSAQPDWPLLGDTQLNERLETVRVSFSPVATGEKPLPWYVHDKLRTQGSQATLLLASIVGTKEGACFAIKAVSVGDCCLLLLRANGERRAFPIENAADFGVYPALVGTHPGTPFTSARWEDQLNPGDVLLACTDAVAKWILQCWETYQTDALFGWLIRLLSPMDPEPGSIQTAPETANCPSEPKLAARRMNIATLFVGRLRSWLGIQSKAREVREAEAEKTIGERGDATAVQAKPHLNAEFSEFIEDNRARRDALRMRNDDSTLVICLPVQRSAGDRGAAALEVIQRQLDLAAR